jgi:sucrose-6-phosphate hydrolase SacC (GH32 family)
LSSVEIFINDGERVMTEIIFPNAPYNYVKLEKENPEMVISKVAPTLK